ncbi:hypothetical protein [Actinacidiphila bryophytorum]|uniref:Uncharacterized protein n=1 Tax=Actinacidiphila bryophytorum TaxID=1436133 RepID=A0A9W4E4A8_9ACTN|nr:hypothetical protein [Actinacidiphila bryophytorum]MBM9434429.1 hypothetical protein [Actinacidiphila bryophytorum]MBN6541903.1 hypothetical protein [Actinacidiphila bryophytorum]CAG7625995.1 hypothetical protein SBRY_20217 [Actinacidiphila bryophytorum]
MSRARSETYIATRRVLYKPELKPQIVAFIREKEAAHSSDIGREFFNGDGHQTRRYLSALKSEGQITSTRRGKYLWWSLAGVEVTEAELAARTPKPVGRPGPRLTEEQRQAKLERRARKAREKRQEERAKRPTPAKPRSQKRDRHVHCIHENTRAEQTECRRAKRKAERKEERAKLRPARVTRTLEEQRAAKNERNRLRYAARKLRASEEKLADEISLAMTEQWLTQVEMHCAAAEEEVGEYNPMDGIRERNAERRKETRERLEAEGKLYGWRTHVGFDRMGHGPTVYQLARYIHARMKNDREHKGWYRFTYEWVNSHYPHLLANYRDLVEDSLELLVIQGKIERLDMPVKAAVSGV